MKIQKKFLNTFEVLFIILMGLLLCVVMTGMQRNIEWYNILFVTCVLFAAMAVLYGILCKLEVFLERYEQRILVSFIVIWGIALYVFSYVFRSRPAHDYPYIYTILHIF